MSRLPGLGAGSAQYPTTSERFFLLATLLTESVTPSNDEMTLSVEPSSHLKDGRSDSGFVTEAHDTPKIGKQRVSTIRAESKEEDAPSPLNSGPNEPRLVITKEAPSLEISIHEMLRSVTVQDPDPTCAAQCPVPVFC
jgi:hypothetical protein